MPNGESATYPDMSQRTIETTSDYLNGRIGVKLDVPEIVQLLGKMSLGATRGSSDNSVIVSIPPTRSDILHACDVAEDVAIAYGYNNIAETTPQAYTVGAAFPLNKLSDVVKREIALAGYTEVLPLVLCSHDENFAWLKRTDDNKTAVKLANPKSLEYQTIASNKDHPMPIKIFEVADVVLKDDTLERRARNERRVGLIYANVKGAGFELVHGMLDRIMAMLDVPLVKVGQNGGYYIKESESPTFFPGRRADIYYNQKQIGSLGILHPEVIQKFDFIYPCSALEFNLEPFL
ncbi:phenylalanine--tRNA ligase subunit beta [Phlyctochytrium bullatum]|nr:phenylalanine--tRNA ligase subunit beta [Phlyctochytrium bullatum]